MKDDTPLTAYERQHAPKRLTEDEPIALHRQRRTPVQLPERGALAEAAVLAYVRGDDRLIPRDELEAQRQRVLQLRDPTAPDSLDELARQLPTLEALWQVFAVEAIDAKSPEVRVKYLKAALQAQQAYARTFTLLRTLAHQKSGNTAASVIDDDSHNER